jgi:membrane protease YdiL (CAAX protease family)
MANKQSNRIISKEIMMKIFKKIGLFFVITFVFTILLSLVQQLLGINPTQVSLPQFGPGIAALVMLRLFRKDQVKLTVTLKGIHPLKYLAALVMPLVVPAILFLVYNQFVAPISVPSINGPAFLVMLVGIMLGAFGEELGWRGYAQNLLTRERNNVVAFLVVGVVWGVLHIGNFQNGPVFMLFFVFSTIGYSAVMGWLVQGANSNVVLPTLFHFSVNVGFFILQDAVTDVRIAALNGLVWMGAAVLVVLRSKKRYQSADKPQFVPGQ